MVHVVYLFSYIVKDKYRPGPLALVGVVYATSYLTATYILLVSHDSCQTCRLAGRMRASAVQVKELSPESLRFAAGVPEGHVTRDEEISPHFRRDLRHPR